jgi:hypothetical protein
VSDLARELAGEAATAHGRRLPVEGVRRRPLANRPLARPPLARGPLASSAPLRDGRDPEAGEAGWVNGQSASAPARIIVDIGELVFDGLPPTDRDLVAATFEAELTRLLAESRAPYSPDAPLGAGTGADAGAGLDLARLTALPPLPATTSAGRLGRALARSVHAGLTAGAVADE